MRGIGKHTPPEHMQPKPADNTSKHVMRQVQAYDRSRVHGQRSFVPEGYQIHSESAREIAAWFQSLGANGIKFGAFASSGTITKDLAADIEREIREFGPNPTNAEHEAFICPLRALLAYVRASGVEVWKVSQGTPQYVMRGGAETGTKRVNGSVFMLYTDATEEFRNRLESIDVLLFGEQVRCLCDELECTCADRQAQIARGDRFIVWHSSDCPRRDTEYIPEDECEPCAAQRTANAFIADMDNDRTPWGDKGPSFREFSYRPKSQADPAVFRLERVSMTYGEFLKAHGKDD